MPPKIRTRSGSTSSTASVDLDRVNWQQERSVVKTLDTNADQNTWPTFELIGVTVYAKDGKTMKSALDVSTQGPFIVRGHLMIEDPEQRIHLIKRIRQPSPLEIPNCKVYSVGDSHNGEAIIWVGGEGAWYEIKPSTQYIPIYEKMCEATRLYYRLLDWHERNRSAAKKLAAAKVELGEVFLHYAKHIGDGSTYLDVCKRCTQHGNFLMQRFEHDDNIGEYPWKKSHMYRWLASRKAEFKSDQTQGLPVRTQRLLSQSPPSARRTRHSDSSVLPSVEAEGKKKSKAPSSTAATDTSRPILEIEPLADPFNDTPLRALLTALETSFDGMANDKTPMTVTKLLNRFYFTYKFPTHRPKDKNSKEVGSHRRPVEEVFHRNAKDLIKLIQKDKYGVIYDWLEQLARTPLRLEALQPNQFPYSIVPRGASSQRTSQIQAQVSEPSSRRSSQPSTPPHAGKSLKTPGRSVKSVLRPITSGTKRLRQEDETIASSNGSPSRKVQHVSADNSGSSDDDSMDIDMPNIEDEAFFNSTISGSSKPMMKLFEERISSIIPRGNSRPWLCTESDCSFSVRSGDDLADRTKMKEHLDEHRRASRMDILMAEERAHLPIGYAPLSLPLSSPVSPPPAASLSLDLVRRYNPFLAHLLDAAFGVDSTLQQAAIQANQQPPVVVSEEQAFRNLVVHFKRQPHPVSDKITSLTQI